MKNNNKNYLTNNQKKRLLRAKNHTTTILETINAALKDDATEFQIRTALILTHQMGIR